MRRRRLLMLVSAASLALGLAAAGLATSSAAAASSSSTAVGETPAAATPTITSADSTVWKLAQCGNTMYAVGAFSQVAQGGVTYTRNNAFSFNATTGALTDWDPNLKGSGVDTIALSANCAIAYVGGSFQSIGGVAARNFAAISTASGKLYTPVAHSADRVVRSILIVNGGRDLLVGGYYTSINAAKYPYLNSLSPYTGQQTNYLKASIAGKLDNTVSGSTMVYNMQLAHSGRAVLIEGDFTKVGGQARQQIAELSLSSTIARVATFVVKPMLTTHCADNEAFYTHAAAFSPDGRTVYIATTGYTGTSSYCDAVVAFTNTSPATTKWINKTGRDSLYTVTATATDVYIGGHERWADNAKGVDSCGPGCVDRQGIGDIDATTGKATAWNPTRDRGHGADDLLLTSAGLWVASDTYFGSAKCAGQDHPGICMFPNATSST